MSDSTSKSDYLTPAIILGFLPILAIVPLPLPDFAPYSLTTILPILLAYDFGNPLIMILGIILIPFVLLAPGFLFLRVARYIQRTGNLIPRWTLPTLIVIFLLSATWAVFGWKNTVSYVSIARAYALAIESLVPPIVIIGWFVIFRSKLSVPRSILLHWATFAWFLWSAFPLYGELL